MAKNGQWKLLAAVVCSALTTFAATSRQAEVIGGPRGISPYLFKGVSQKNLVETARDHQWSLQFVKSRPDTLNIIAIRIQFKPDTATQTTGNGIFGSRGSSVDKEEDKYYASDTIYPYDALPHDSLYFVRQLDAVKKYFQKASRGNLTLDFSVYPPGNGQTGYVADTTMPFYSPGGKKKKESWDEYYERKTIGLMTFVRDAVKAADADKKISPFTGLRYEPSDKTIRDSLGRKTVFLIFHAGASYLTDGGALSGSGQYTPSDMIDIFVTRDILKYYRDTLKLDGDGVSVTGRDGKPLLIDELMMCAETSNQDGLNWGIQGIIVNQIARQLGIPDLFSTSNGISGIGSFCIMDVAGYSAGNGFIPPYPSAWVRAFMGWDRAYTVPFGSKGSFNVKALTSVLDRDTSGSFTDAGDTTILLVPINDHEYYLIENRQRNLTGNRELFRYDTLDIDKPDSVVIMSYPYVANIEKNVLATSGKTGSNVIQRVRNNDVAIPASGILVWHVDERIIRDRLAYNGVNADSLYRGVSLVEADGITDLGIMFQDIFYQAAFDYGGAEDVFPHRTRIDGKDTVIAVSSFGPFTRPSSRANDGGHTYLDLAFEPSTGSRTELTALGKNDGYHIVTNYSDSVFSVSVKWDYLVESWPRRAAPGKFFDPLFVDVDKSSPGNELFLLDESGRAYLWSSSLLHANRFNFTKTAFDRIGLHGDTLRGVDTALYFDSIHGACAMPSAIAGTIFVPSTDKSIYCYAGSPDSAAPRKSSIRLASSPSTYVCNYRDSTWAVGCTGGRVIFGSMRDTVRSVQLSSNKPVCALAALRESGSMVVAIQTDGTLSLVNEQPSDADSSVTLPDVAIGPFSLLTGNLDNSTDSLSEIIVSDSRHGMWVYNRSLKLAPGWEAKPTDWPSYYTTDTTENRSKYPVNLAPPALADIDRDGFLDIIIGGTNGLYAFNYKGAMKSHWPAFLDTRADRWFQRGSVVSSPAVVTGSDRQPLVLFSSITGENLTYRFTKVTSADSKRGIVWFKSETGTPDSIEGLTASQIDTILTMSDSIVGPYIIPGGFLDAVNAKAQRPRGATPATPQQSGWPLTTGSALATSPLIGFMDNNNTPDVVAVSSDGWVYRWELAKSILPDSLFWPQTGYSAGRTFAFGGKAPPRLVSDIDPISFFSFPNPTRNAADVAFKYKFNGPATNVRLDIYSYTGYKVYSHTSMGTPPRDLTGSFPDWNIHMVSLRGIGPGVYRCRLEATIGGKKQQRYWKMAVIK